LAVFFGEVFDECASEAVHDSVQRVVLVPVAVELVAHDDGPVSFEPVRSRFQIALPLKTGERLVLVSHAEVVN
jgi:hypothetical protein